MDNEYLLKAYNQHERINLTLAGCRKDIAPDLVRFTSSRDRGSCISYSNIEASQLDARINDEINYFNQLNLGFKWHTLNTDAPENLDDSLIDHGFLVEETSALMVLDLASVEAHECVNNQLFGIENSIEVVDKQGIKDAISVQKKVWKGNCIDQESFLLRLKEESPEQIRIYVIYQEKKPVSSAWLMCHPHSPFGSIWAGNTLAPYRGKGFYSMLLAKRIQDAKAQGLKYLSIHASNMSQPIVAKHGFKFVAQSISYTSPVMR